MARTGDGGVGDRLRRYQRRFEPVVVRVLLAGIFVNRHFDSRWAIATRPQWRQGTVA